MSAALSESGGKMPVADPRATPPRMIIDPAQEIVAALRRCRFRVGNEADMQVSIGEALTGAGFDHEREYRLSAADRIDFMIGAVGLEAKTRCNKRAIFRQLQRYAEHDTIEALILVTGTAIGLPAAINGKPIYLVATGRAAL